MTNKAGEQSPAHFLPYLNPLLNPFTTSQPLEEKVKTRYPLRDNGFPWSCWADLNRRPHPYQAALELFSNYFSYFIAIYTPICLLSATF